MKIELIQIYFNMKEMRWYADFFIKGNTVKTQISYNEAKDFINSIGIDNFSIECPKVETGLLYYIPNSK